jgi:uncharacterized membrane protein YoaK (UPF0700 family)
MAAAETRVTLPLLLSLNAGYVDTAGFLALQGLFTAHVTGNFVTLGASLALGTSGAIAKLMALPVFCVVVIVARLLGTFLSTRVVRVFEVLYSLQVLLLIGGAALAIRFGPFHDGDSWQAILTGMVLVSAMAIQNAVHRVHLGSAPPSTLMTGTTTQIMLDLADRIYPRAGETPATGFAAGPDVDQSPRVRDRMRRRGAAVFAVQCLVLRRAADRGNPLARRPLGWIGEDRALTRPPSYLKTAKARGFAVPPLLGRVDEVIE